MEKFAVYAFLIIAIGVMVLDFLPEKIRGAIQKILFGKSNEMENQLGKSIVKSALIIAVAMVLCMIIYSYSKERYTRLDERFYIDQRTGIVHLTAQEFKNNQGN
jgi:hypothetical protein